MNQELWQRAEKLFHAAVERSQEGRQAFLDQACGADAELRRQVEKLVFIDEHAGSLLERPPACRRELGIGCFSQRGLSKAGARRGNSL